MERGSEYEFRIFVSSTDYDLVDLRHELSTFLDEFGYHPVLSSESGFPDTHGLNPWESCLPVLETCQFVVFVIDSRYGEPLEWPNYKAAFNDRKVSPTHGEFLYARYLKKRIIVFIREKVMNDYAWFREAYEKHGRDLAKVAESITVPKHVDLRALQFVNEIKQAKPWICTFKHVAEIKSQVQKRIINDLVNSFALQEHHLYKIIHTLIKASGELSNEQKNAYYEAIGVSTDMKKKDDEIATLKLEIVKVKADAHSSAEAKKALDEKLQAAEIEKTRAALLGIDSKSPRMSDAFRASSAIEALRAYQANMDISKVYIDALKPSIDFEAIASRLQALQPKIDLEGIASKMALQPSIDMEAIASKALQPAIDMERFAAKALQPAIDMERIAAKALQPAIDMEAITSKMEAMPRDPPKLSLDALVPTKLPMKKPSPKSDEGKGTK